MDEQPLERQVSNRSELKEYVSRVLRRAFPGAAPHLYLKVYILDVHSKTPEEPIKAAVERVAGYQQGEVHGTDDASIFFLSLKRKTRGDWAEAQPFLIDTFDRRFWIVFSSGETPEVDAIQGQLLARVGIDRAWFPPGMLKKPPLAEGSWQRMGLKLSFDDRQLLYGGSVNGGGGAGIDESEEAAEEDIAGEMEGEVEFDESDELESSPYEGTHFRVEIKSPQSDSFVHGLLNGGDSGWPIVRASFVTPGDEREDSVRSRVSVAGRFVATGGSASSFMAFLNAWHRGYAKRINRLERFFRYGGDNRGRPVNIKFDKPIPDLRSYVDNLLSSRVPFRLWGVPEMSGDDFARVHAIDLHVNSPLYLEIGKRFLRLYMGEKTCGNTVARLYANILERHDWRARILDPESDEPVL